MVARGPHTRGGSFIFLPDNEKRSQRLFVVFDARDAEKAQNGAVHHHPRPPDVGRTRLDRRRKRRTQPEIYISGDVVADTGKRATADTDDKEGAAGEKKWLKIKQK